MVKYEVNFKGKLAGGRWVRAVRFDRGVWKHTSPAREQSVRGEEVRIRLHSGAGASSIPGEQSSRDIYRIKNMKVNRQSHYRTGRREPSRVSTLSSGVCPSSVTVEGAALPTAPRGRNGRVGASRGGEGQGCGHRDLGSCMDLATLQRLYPGYFLKFECVEFEMSILANFLRIS